jgi:hypothetical protein
VTGINWDAGPQSLAAALAEAVAERAPRARIKRERKARGPSAAVAGSPGWTITLEDEVIGGIAVQRTLDPASRWASDTEPRWFWWVGLRGVAVRGERPTDAKTARAEARAWLRKMGVES